jgi:hypothetical protein
MEHNELIQWIDKESERVRTRVLLNLEELHQWCEDNPWPQEWKDRKSFVASYGYDKLKLPISNNKIYTNLEQAFTNCNDTKTEALLRMMADNRPQSMHSSKYDALLYNLTCRLKERFDSRHWQPCQADVVQMLYIYHPDKEMRRSGLEFMISNKINSGTGNSFVYELCSRTGGCHYVFTRYVNEDDYDGYFDVHPNCVVHGNSIYDEESRFKAWTTLKERLYTKIHG